MAEPTLQDVLDAIAKIDAKVDGLDAKVDSLDARVTARFDRVDKQLAELDKDLSGHMNVHRELEKDIELLKGRPPRTAARAPRRR